MEKTITGVPPSSFFPLSILCHGIARSEKLRGYQGSAVIKPGAGKSKLFLTHYAFTGSQHGNRLRSVACCSSSVLDVCSQPKKIVDAYAKFPRVEYTG